jgi:hypothetical protein
VALSNIKRALAVAAHPHLLDQLRMESSRQADRVGAVVQRDTRDAFRHQQRDPDLDRLPNTT